MRRIIVVCVIIIALIVVLDLYLQRYVNNTFDMMSSMLNDISYNLDNNEDSMKKIENLDETWKNNYTRMACFLEHDELEKINTQITVIKAGIEEIGRVGASPGMSASVSRETPRYSARRLSVARRTLSPPFLNQPSIVVYGMPLPRESSVREIPRSRSSPSRTSVNMFPPPLAVTFNISRL